MQQPLNETWPDFYKFTVEEFPIGYCGTLSIDLVHDCCVSTLDFQSSFGIASGTAMVVPDNDLEYAMNQYAAGGTYCILQSDGFNLVNGYDAIYLLNDNICYDKYQCSKNGTVSIFTESGCQGELLNVALHFEPLEFEMRPNEMIVGRILKGSENKIQISWITYMPTYLAIPTRDNIWDRLQYVCIYASVTGDVIILAYSVYRYFKVKRRFLLLSIITFFFWLLSNFSAGYYALTALPDVDTQYFILEFVCLLQNVATFLTVMLTTFTVFGIMRPAPTLRFKYTVCCVILLLHCGLAGSFYFGICWNPAAKNCMTFDTYIYWTRSMPFWYLFVFLYDIIPPILVTYQLNQASKQRNILTVDLKFTFGIIIQILICILFFIINYIQTNTDILGNDLSYASVVTINCTLITIHSQVNMFISYRLGVVLQKLTQNVMQLKTETK